MDRERATPGLYLRTVRNLRLSQLLYFPLRRGQRALRELAPWLTGLRHRKPRAAPEVDPGLTATQAIVETLRSEALATSTSAERLTVLDHTVSLGEIDWEEHYEPPLWAYHLHYFEDTPVLALRARAGDQDAATALDRRLRSWLGGCRPGHGPGWDPYPISQRLVNWAWVDLLLWDLPGWDGVLSELRRSCIQQASYLSANLEYHLLANHLLKNAKALFVAGLVWTGAKRLNTWRKRGRDLLQREVEEQVLTDGGHFERSPMYHGGVLRDLLEVQLLARAAGEPDVVGAQLLGAMLQFQTDLTQPDGTRARFNDTAEGMFPDTERVEALARVLDPAWSSMRHPIIDYRESGYFGYRDEAGGELFVIDAGPPGPTYQPGHVHCDLLSFEFYKGGRAWIVDPGVRGYDGDPYRAYCRSTRAHNTLVLDQREQSEIWSSFRVARTARLRRVKPPTIESGKWHFRAAYSPYHAPHTVHERAVERRSDGTWLITDHVSGLVDGSVTGFLHFHPDVEVTLQGDQLICDRAAERLVIFGQNVSPWRLARGASDPVAGWFFPKFGVALPAWTVSYDLLREDSTLRLAPGK